MKDQIEKQAIEEMAKIISQHTVKNCEEVPFDYIKQMNDGFCIANVPSCGSCKAARCLCNAGYRKQSEGVWMTHHCTNCGRSPRGRTIIYKTFTCDACGKSNGRRKTPFCPNCGAKMLGGDINE